MSETWLWHSKSALLTYRSRCMGSAYLWLSSWFAWLSKVHLTASSLPPACVELDWHCTILVPCHSSIASGSQFPSLDEPLATHPSHCSTRAAITTAMAIARATTVVFCLAYQRLVLSAWPLCHSWHWDSLSFADRMATVAFSIWTACSLSSNNLNLSVLMLAQSLCLFRRYLSPLYS